ncbi:MAG: ribosomal protein S18-alanine N-acetyltransferase [Campylobacteraceae bacterium]|jgi:ribosomal-protein-alanine N-acetyltransferase|nr:ribosomal protein S18-alanine N-acetyltransferase [Campylobacteraceae bacterium]
MRIKAASGIDLKALCEIENEVFDKNSYALSYKNFLYHIGKNPLFVCEIDNKTAGYILLLKQKQSSKTRIYSIAVKKEFQSRGVGIRLLEKSFTWAEENGKKAIKLEVNAANFSAIKLYKKAGFVKIGVLTNYYPDGANAILMEKLLDIKNAL